MRGWAVVLALLLGCRAGPANVEGLPGRGAAATGQSLVLLGDTQRTTWMERLIGREQNDAGRQLLIEKLAREERPAFVVHLGDMVSWGHAASEWEYFDRLMAPIAVPVHPVLGNHDYWGVKWLALQNARERFPELVPLTYRTLRLGGLGLVLTDSNLEDREAAEQARWFEASLAAFEADASVHGVLVFSHHPPFTNGERRQDDPWVTAALLPAFLRSRKAVLLASGHVHGYERFERGGKTFLVSGGGGGPRVVYRVGARASHAALYAPSESRPRPFHYVVIEPRPRGLQVTVKCVPADGACASGLLEAFQLALPP